MAKHAVQHDRLPGRDAAPPGSTEPTVLYVDGGVGFGGSSISLSLTLRAIHGVRKLLVTSQKQEIIDLLFSGIPAWRIRRWVNYRTRSTLSRMVRRLRVPVLSWVVSRTYSVLDMLVTGFNTLRLYRIIRKHGVDLVHVNNGYRPQEGVYAARLAGVPVVGHLRGILGPPFTPAATRNARDAACTISVSEAAVADLRKTVPEARIVTVYNPVDLELIAGAAADRDATREELDVEPGDILVAIFGRVVRWKGQLEFVRACISAMEREPRLVAAIVGDVSDGAAEYMYEIEELVELSGFRSRFLFTGYRSDVERLFAAIDIAVHASISPEPFGRVLPEAMAASKPVIATDAGGPREIITDGVDGFLVPMGDVTAMSQRITELAGDAELRRSIGERASATVRRRFTIRHTAEGVRAVYREILGTV